MPEKVVRVLGANRITLPTEWREKYGLVEGDYVKCTWDGDDEAMAVTPLEKKEKKGR